MKILVKSFLMLCGLWYLCDFLYKEIEQVDSQMSVWSFSRAGSKNFFEAVNTHPNPGIRKRIAPYVGLRPLFAGKFIHLDNKTNFKFNQNRLETFSHADFVGIVSLAETMSCESMDCFNEYYYKNTLLCENERAVSFTDILLTGTRNKICILPLEGIGIADSI